MATKNIYKVVFVNQGKVYEIYARRVGQGELFGFIEVEQLVFGERSSVVLDPSEERIKSEFAGVKRSFLPMHSVLRIDEVPEQGVSKITAWEMTPRVVPMPRMRICWVVSTPSAAAEVPATAMNKQKVAIAITLFAMGANIGAPNRPRAFNTWPRIE